MKTLKWVFWLLILATVVNNSAKCASIFGKYGVVHGRINAVVACNYNQYFDKEEGRCMGIPGGGKAVDIDSTISCGSNILKSHCSNSKYYYICKVDKTILAQCADEQLFDNRLQRCIYVDPQSLSEHSIQSNHIQYKHLHLPACITPGRFPVVDYCNIFYTCQTDGLRFHQTVFKCPQDTSYYSKSGTCIAQMNCKNDLDENICALPVNQEMLETNLEYDTESKARQKKLIQITDFATTAELSPESELSNIDSPLEFPIDENLMDDKNDEVKAFLSLADIDEVTETSTDEIFASQDTIDDSDIPLLQELSSVTDSVEVLLDNAEITPTLVSFRDTTTEEPLMSVTNVIITDTTISIPELIADVQDSSDSFTLNSYTMSTLESEAAEIDNRETYESTQPTQTTETLVQSLISRPFAKDELLPSESLESTLEDVPPNEATDTFVTSVPSI